MVGVAMVAVFAMILVRCVVRGGVIGVHAVMVVMIVHVKADGHDVASRMTIRAHRRRPGNLERNDEHDDQGNEAAHGAEYKPMAAGMRQAGADTICLPLVKFLSGTSSAA